MTGIAPTRVPLPLDLAEDGPIYVNAKQYHGIMRRRQIRAKLEAQNKLVKNRKVLGYFLLFPSFHFVSFNELRYESDSLKLKKKRVDRLEEG